MGQPGESFDRDEWEEHTRTHVWIDGQWWDRTEWENATKTNWWGLIAAVPVTLGLIVGAVALLINTWDWLVEWVPVIIGAGLLLVIVIGTLSRARP